MDIQEYKNALIERHTSAVQEKLSSAHVGIAGLGGLGSHIVTAFARMGLGKITGYDFDKIELSNIHRQNYCLEQIGMLKTEALSSLVKKISPIAETNFINIKINEDNISNLFCGCDIIIEALDSASAKVMLFDGWLKHYQEKYYIGASGVAGYDNKYQVTIKKLGERAYIVGDFVNETGKGLSLMASKVGLVAYTQANLAINLLLKGGL